MWLQEMSLNDRFQSILEKNSFSVLTVLTFVCLLIGAAVHCPSGFFCHICFFMYHV